MVTDAAETSEFEAEPEEQEEASRVFTEESERDDENNSADQPQEDSASEETTQETKKEEEPSVSSQSEAELYAATVLASGDGVSVAGSEETKKDDVQQSPLKNNSQTSEENAKVISTPSPFAC